MEPIDPKLLGQRVQAERKARNLTQSELASQLSMARTTLVAIEKGERPLSPTEITKLAEQWGIAVSDIVRPRPIVNPISAQLRAAIPSSGFKGTDIEGLDNAAERLRRLGEYSLELEELLQQPLPKNYPALYQSKMPVDIAAADVASRERYRLALGDGPLPHLRSILENDVGLRIFLLRLPSRIAGMFAYDAKIGGCIALNIGHPAERRLWTLAHEYWHFLADRYESDICVLPSLSPRRSREGERLADAFADHFLMPETGLSRRFHELKSTKNDGLTPADLLHLKRQYGVSFQALTLRLEKLNLIRSGTWQKLSDAGFRVREAEAIVGLPPREDNEESLPLHYRLLAVEAFDQGEISKGELVRFLDCDYVEAARIVQDLSHEYLMSDDGTWGELELAPGEPLAPAA